MSKRSGRPTQGWKTFVNNHLTESIAIDFVVVPTITFKLFYVFVVLDLRRRRILQLRATRYPTAEWAGQQLVEALPWESEHRFLFRDGDGIYGNEFRSRAESLGLEEVVSARGSPWQNGYAERVIGTLRRECLDHVIVTGEGQLQNVLVEFEHYYNEARTHMSLSKDSPNGRRTWSIGDGPLLTTAFFGGLHHRYDRIPAGVCVG